MLSTPGVIDETLQPACLQVAGGLAALYPAGSAPISDAATAPLAAAEKLEHDGGDGADGVATRDAGDAADAATVERDDNVAEAAPQQAATSHDEDGPAGVRGGAAAAEHEPDTVCSCPSEEGRKVTLHLEQLDIQWPGSDSGPCQLWVGAAVYQHRRMKQR